MTETLKQRTGQSLAESLELHQRYLEGGLSYDEYVVLRESERLQQIREQLSKRGLQLTDQQLASLLARQRRPQGASDSDSLGVFLAGLLVGVLGAALIHELVAKR